MQPALDVDETVDVTIDVASVCYTHSPRFIKELDETATEFKNYITQFKESLKVSVYPHILYFMSLHCRFL